MRRDNVNIPTIKGRIAERLQRARRRDREELDFGEELHDLTLRTPAERGTVALALLVLEQLAEHGGTRAPQRALQNTLRKLLGTLSPKQIMDIEIETYELMLWIGSAIDPEWTHEEELDPSQIDPHAGTPELIRWAIATGQDLELDYYSRNRGELTSRKITPLSVEAETYVHAYCHLRRDERVFRVSRIADIRPVGGWKKVKKAVPTPRPEPEPEDDGQMDLL